MASFQGDAAVIKTLQEALPREASMNLQMRHDWRSLKFRGLKKLAKHFHKLGTHAHDWMKAVDDRLLFLGGEDGYSIPPIIEPATVTAMMQNALDMLLAKIAPYEDNIQIAMNAKDDTTRNLFEHLLKWSEKDVAWLQTQLSLIEALSEPVYLAEKL